MELDLKYLKDIRKQLGLSQQTLASLAGVSQSLIAKIEQGMLDPSYTNAKKILKTLQSLIDHHTLKAKDLMKQPVISLPPSASLTKAVTLMNEHNISQLPIVSNHHVVGLVTEKTLLDGMMAKKKILKDIMLSPPPLIPPDAALTMIQDLLHYWPVVLVVEHHTVQGIIAKADLLSVVLAKHMKIKNQNFK